MQVFAQTKLTPAKNNKKNIAKKQSNKKITSKKNTKTTHTKKKNSIKKPLFYPEKNKIQYASHLQNFYVALQNLQKKKQQKVTILHIGDSHIQADFFTGKMRKLLQQKYGNGGRGLIFPYKTANSTQPDNYLVTQTGTWQAYSSVRTNSFSQWGLSGFSVKTTDENATINLQPTHINPEKITKIKIFYPLFDKTFFDLKLLAGHKEIKNSKIDSNGYVEYSFTIPQKLVSLYFKQQHLEQTQFVLQGLTWENEDKGIVYHTAGVNGADIESFLRCADFQKHIAALKPDIVIISLGANDVLVPNFKADLFAINYKILLRQIKNANPKASILLTSPNVSYNFDKKPNIHLDKLVETLETLAKTEKLGFWDFYTVSGKKENVGTWLDEGLLKNDKVHLSRKGYELQAEHFFKALIK